MMAMLVAGGANAAGATPPFYENPKAMLPGSRWSRLAAKNALALFEVAKFDRTLPPALLGAFVGKVVKLTGPSDYWIPPRARVLWMERPEAERLAAAVRWYDGHFDAKEVHRIFRGGARWHSSRHVLAMAGAMVLDIDYHDVVGGDSTCTRAVDRIVDFLELPLDRDAMVARAAEHVRRGCPDNTIHDPDQWTAAQQQLADYKDFLAEFARFKREMMAA